MAASAHTAVAASCGRMPSRPTHRGPCSRLWISNRLLADWLYAGTKADDIYLRKHSAAGLIHHVRGRGRHRVSLRLSTSFESSLVALSMETDRHDVLALRGIRSVVRFSNPCQKSYVPFVQRFTRNAPLYKIGTASRKIPCKILKLKVWLPGMGSNHDKPKKRRICNVQIPQRPRMPQWTRKTTTRTPSVHGTRSSRCPPNH